jgi:hypothetical protein
MAKMKVKLDTKKFKQFFVARGELIGLGAACVLLVLCFAVTVLAILNSGPQAPRIAKDADDLKNRINGSAPPPLTETKENVPNWVARTDNARFASGHWFDGSGTGTNKREKPILLAVDKGAKNIQVVYVAGSVFTWDLDRERAKLRAFDTGEGEKKGATGKVETPQGADKQDKAMPRAVELTRPIRMVVVNATFPYGDQVELYQKALRIVDADELFAKGLQPIFHGINVLRAEVSPGQAAKDLKWEPLYTFVEGNKHADDRVVAAPRVIDLLKDAVFDEDNVTQLQEYLTPFAATPLPQLATGHYPRVVLADINPVPLAKSDDKGKYDKRKKGGTDLPFIDRKKKEDRASETLPTEKVDFKDLPKDALDKITGKFNVVDYLGLYTNPPMPMEPDAKDAKDPKNKEGATFPKRPPRNPREFPQGGKPGEFTNVSNGYAFTKVPGKGKALVRFIDVDVQPGMTYQYKIQVVFLNPNYRLVDEVTHPDVATPRILVDKEKFVETPKVTVPKEYHFYVFDQMSPDQDGKTPDLKKLATKLVNRPTTIDTKAPTLDQAVVQIQKWVESTKDAAGQQFDIGDWVVAERLLVYRGEKIGRKSPTSISEGASAIEVETPVWQYDRNAFEIGSGVIGPPKKGVKDKGPVKTGVTVTSGIPVDFLVRKGADDLTDVAPVVVDFEGGRGGARQYDSRADGEGKRRTHAEADATSNSPVEMLLLGPDGRLMALNSRDDRNGEAKPGERAHERSTRWREWMARLNEVRDRQFPPETKEDVFKKGPKKGGG